MQSFRKFFHSKGRKKVLVVASYGEVKVFHLISCDLRDRELFLSFLGGWERFSKYKELHNTFKNNSSIGKWTFLLCSWHIFFTLKFTALQLLVMFFCFSGDAYNTFQTLYASIRKHVKFYFDLYGFKTKVCSYNENFIPSLNFSFVMFFTLLQLLKLKHICILLL